jgi:glycosyltransferase involved in cell wall biosynthesis
MKKIMYIGYYNSLKNNQKRNITLSAVNKMNYIIEILDKEFEINVLSVSESRENKSYPLTEEKLFDNSKLILLPTKKTGNKFQRLFQRMLIRCSLIKYILKNTDKNTKVIVYHSLGYTNTIKWLKKIRNFNLILEVEEIYADVMSNKKIRRKEIEFFKYADSFIFPIELLNKEINKNNKPYITVHGTYKVEEQRSSKFRERDGKIHIVYAGTFDPRKGGAAAAAAAAEFLCENYHIHILGFGSQEDTNNMKKIILETSKKTKCTVTYDGLKSGEEYIRFIQSCDIGLSTQNPDADFNGTSFPSKILSYMSNGLRVVSINIPAIKESDIGDYMYYYEKQTPKEIARAIQKVNIDDDYNARRIISYLDKKFTKELFKIIK